MSALKTFKFAIITTLGQWTYVDENAGFQTTEEAMQDLQDKVKVALSNRAPLIIPSGEKRPCATFILFDRTAVVHIWPEDDWAASQLSENVK